MVMDKALEAVARAICGEVNDQPYDALPEVASYIERKTHVHRPIMDKQEAHVTAQAAISAYIITSKGGETSHEPPVREGKDE